MPEAVNLPCQEALRLQNNCSILNKAWYKAWDGLMDFGRPRWHSQSTLVWLVHKMLS